MRHGKVLIVGLLVAAALAVTAVSALGGVEEDFVGKGAFSGKQGAAGKNILTTSAGNVECEVAKFSGTASKAEEQNVKPVYEKCTAFGVVSAKVTTNECELVFKNAVDTKAETKPEEHSGEGGVKCPAGKSIVISSSTCKATIPTQTGLKTLAGLNGGSEQMTVTATLKGISYELSAGCPAPKGSYANGEYAGQVNVEGLEVE